MKKTILALSTIGVLSVGVLGDRSVTAMAATSGSSTGNHSGVSWAKQNSYVFNDSFMKYVKSRHDTVSVAVYDANTGQTYTYDPDAVYCTASIVKVTLMTTLLYKDQVAHKPITEAQNRLLVPMIEDSDNEAASDIWNQLGRGRGITPYLRKFGMNHTVMRNDSMWGLTQTNVLDQVTLLKLLAYHNQLIDDAHRAYALNLMEHVTSWQRWGVSAGVPSGTTVALKNGWSPYTWNNWRINSIGYINGHGHNYVIAVMTFNNPSEQYGIDTVEGISRILWDSIGYVDKKGHH
jgi:beta-lactamase class A